MRTSPVLWTTIVLSTLASHEPAPGADSEPTSTAVVSAPARNPGVPLAELVVLAPGTQVDRSLPQGWTNLIVKSVPRLASGDLNTLPGMASKTATLLHTSILAEVRAIGDPSQPQYVLRRVGLGLCTPVKGRDTVVSSNSQQTLGVDLGLVGRTVLDKAEQELRRGRIIARSPTFVLFSAPCIVMVGTAHRELLLRYAMLVDPADGALRTLVWAVDPDPPSRVAAETMVLVKPGVVYDCALDVSADRIFGTVPVSWSFAIRSLPPGQTRSVPTDVQPWSVKDVRSPLETNQLEEALRLVLVDSPRTTLR